MQMRKIFIVLTTGLLLSGCVNDPIYNTDHPDQAKLTVTTGWNDRGTDIDKPSGWFITSTGLKEEAKTDRYTLSSLLVPGDYRFFLYNEVAAIPVTNGTATVQTIANPADETTIYIEPMPDWLFTGMLAATLEKDSDYELTVPMHQQVRQLSLVIIPQGISAGYIESITSTLSGVAGAWEIETNSPTGNPMNVAPEFIRQTNGNWVATVRLVGVTGTDQLLTGIIRLQENPLTEIQLKSDLTELLSGFNSNKRTPLSLETEITIDPAPEVEVGFTATINGWKKVAGESGIAK